MQQAGKTPLFAAQHAERYTRQSLIRQYQDTYDARLIVMVDQIFPAGITFLEELISSADKAQPLHMILSTPGGDGEVAVRMVRALKSRCSELTIIVPDMAKSAGTIMCLGADKIMMSPSSDLGPVDPQFRIGDRDLVGAKEIQAAVATAEERVSQNPDSFPLYAGLLADVNMLMVQQAQSAMDRSYSLMDEALQCRPNLSPDNRQKLVDALKGPLVDEAKNHGSTVGPEMATALGLPVEAIDPACGQWKAIWELWTRYFYMGAWPAGPLSVYEGDYASQINGPQM